MLVMEKGVGSCHQRLYTRDFDLVYLAWKIPWTEEPGRLQSMGWQKSDTTEIGRAHV